MSGAGLFIYGFVVTLLVVAASALLVWGAVMDGRYEDEMRESREGADRLGIGRTSALEALNEQAPLASPDG